MTKLVCFALLCVLLPLTHISHTFLTQENNKIPIEKIRFNLPSPEVTRISSFGYTNLIADLVWLQFVQYMGGMGGQMKYLPEISSLLETVTTLDSHFIDAYQVGAYALSDNNEFEKAIALLNKGSKSVPDEWFFDYQAGFMYYIYKKNKSEAVKYFEKSMKIKNSSPILPKLVVLLKSELNSDDYDFQIELWKTVYDKSKEHDDKRNMDRSSKKIIEITIKKDIKYLQTIIDKYNSENVSTDDVVYPDDSNSKEKKKETAKTKESKKTIKELKDLIDLKLVDKLPFDPFKRPYLFDAETQKVAAFDLPWK